MADTQPITGTTALYAVRLMNFETSHSDLLPEHRLKLDTEVRGAITSSPNPWVDLIGYASHLGNRAFNQKLSEDRCASVRRYISGFAPGVGFPTDIGRGDTSSAGDSANNDGFWRAVDVLVYGSKPSVRPPPVPPVVPPNPREVALSMRLLPISWCSISLDSLIALQKLIQSGTPDFLNAFVVTRAALGAHFHMSSPETSVTELAFIIARFRDIRDAIQNQAPDIYRNATSADVAEMQKQFGFIPAADTFNKTSSRKGTRFTDQYLAKRDDCKRVILIHEMMHFVEPTPVGPDIVDFPEWQRSNYDDATKMPLAKAIHNPSSYAAAAWHIAHGNDRRDFCT
jgi:hypothetical protein